MIIISFYTADTPYEEQHIILKKSLDKFGLKYDIQKIHSRGSWKANCLYRSEFITDMMDKHSDDVVWIDADAEVTAFPELLVNMDKNVDLAWHDRDGKEIMLGTSYFKNTHLVKHLLMDWAATCDVNSLNISQKDFMRLYNSKYKGKFITQILPEPYCHIFDSKIVTKNPVIVHNQLSRKTRGTIKLGNFITEPVEPLEIKNDITVPVIEVPKPPESLNGKKTIFLPLNQTGWAFDVRCTNLEKYLAPYYNISKVNGFDVARHGLGYKADLVYWPTYESLDSMGQSCHKVCATIGGLVVRSLDESINHFGKARAIAVPNATWYKQYLEKNIPNIKFFLIPNGVDTNIFIPRAKNPKEFIVGWAGNDRPDRAAVKRIEELRNACKKLGIHLIEQGRSSLVKHNQMPSFYQKLDLYVNLSTTEGSNNCILEAAACGALILGTEVGNIPELKQVGAFTVRHDLSDCEYQLEYIRNLTYEQRQDLSSKMRIEMETNYSAEIMSMRYREMFDYSLSVE